LTQQAKKFGADVVLHAMGYYNQPHQEGVYQHFLALNNPVNLPILTYNIPARAIVDIEPETMAKLSRP
jgi:4-hydroxy-tetrahydrodipicolinate synthase